MPDIETFYLVDSHYPWFFPISVFIFGACIGSFLNVCICRMPNDESILLPASHNKQGDRIAWYDNIPILSWFILGGRDRKTGEAFSFRYPLVETLTAVLFLLCWHWLPTAQAAGGMVFCAILIPASFIDLEHMVLPDIFTVGGMCLGVALSAFLPQIHGLEPLGAFLPDAMRGAIIAGLGVIVGSAVVLWIMVIGGYVLRKEVMGEGDVFFMGCIGAFCGWQGALFAIFGGAVIGSAVLLPLMAIEKIRGKSIAPGGKEEQTDSSKNKKDSTGPETELRFGTSVPFGPWLALGGLLYYLWARPYVDEYFIRMAAVLFP